MRRRADKNCGFSGMILRNIAQLLLYSIVYHSHETSKHHNVDEKRATASKRRLCKTIITVVILGGRGYVNKFKLKKVSATVMGLQSRFSYEKSNVDVKVVAHRHVHL